MNLSLPSPSTFRVVPLSHCTSCFQFNLRFHPSNRFRNSRSSSLKLNPPTGRRRRRRIACSVNESDGDKDEEKEAHKNGETQSLEDTSEQSNPPPVDAEQLNKFSDENTNQNDVQDDVRKDGVGETSSAATPATGITEVGSSYLVHQDHVPRGNDDLDSASQTNDHDHDSAPIGNAEEEVGVKDTTVRESNHETFVSNVEATTDKLPQSRHRPCYGWISSDDNDVDLIYFQPPPLPKHIEKLIGKSLAHERPNRKSRWDEKPDDM